MAIFNVNNLTFKTNTENAIKSENITLLKSGDVNEYLLNIEFENEISPSKYTLTFEVPLKNAYGYWSPSSNQKTNIGAEWNANLQNSRSASGMPIISLYAKNNENVSTVYLSDVANALSISVGVVEATVNLKFIITLFTEVMPKITNYAVTLRIDNSKTPFYTAVKNARAWYSEIGFPCAYVPLDATYPLYSFWYSYHQKVYQNDVLKECENAKKYGFKSVIVDDGWQTDDNSTGYAFCGDWEISKSKIPDMKKLVNDVHELGLKFMLWYSVPFVGYNSKNYNKFKGKYLNSIDRLNTSVLDPRFPDVRSYLTNIYVNDVKTYGYDGLKLDFIDRFKLDETSSENYDEMDCRSVEEGLKKLLDETTTKLKEINPEILIEFRQSYIGPVVSTYGNMFRVADCPADAISNKIGSLNLRLTSGSTAVHSDMIIWNYLDSNENVLNQLYGVLFSVPQISVKLNEINNNHKQILKNYLDFWTLHHDTLLYGELKVQGVEFGYTLASSQTEAEKITVLYANTPIVKDGNLTEYIFNATGSNFIYVETLTNLNYQIYDYFGNLIKSDALSVGVNKILLNSGYQIKLYI